MKGTWETTGGGDAAKAVTAVVGLGMVAALAYQAAKGAARTLGEIIVIGVTATVALVAGVGMTVLVMRLRRRRSARPATPAAQLWHANPQAVPVRPRRELPVVNVNIDAGLLAGLMNAAQQPAVPVIVAPAREEIQP